MTLVYHYMTQAKIDAQINQSNSTSCFKVLSYLYPYSLSLIVYLHISITNHDKNSIFLLEIANSKSK